jgi:predicted permease
MGIGRIITSGMESILRDLRLALRRLRLTPGFTLFAIASLALGIGVSTAIYSAVRTLLWTPLGIPNAAELVGVTDGRLASAAMSWPDFQDLRAQQTAAGAVAAATIVRTTLRAGDASQTVFGEGVSGEYFAVMGLRPRYGRLLDARDEASAARVAVLSEAFWRTRLGSDPAVVGRTVSIGGRPFEVVGVVAGTFRGMEPFRPESIWMPVTAVVADPTGFSVDAALLVRRAGASFAVWARLKPGVPLSRLSSEVAVIAARLNDAYPPDRGRSTRVWDAAFHEDQIRRGSEFLRTLVVSILVAITVVLLIACTNLANLALARGTARAQETAVRTALGASRWRLVREHLIETFVIVACGDALAVLVLRRLQDYFSTDLPLGPGITIPFRPEIDVSVLAAALLATLMALLVFGLWPAISSTRSDVRRGVGAGAAATTPRWRFHRNLIAWQVCGSIALLLVAVMTVRILSSGSGSWTRAKYGDTAVVQIDLALNGLDDARARQITGAILDDLRTQPDLSRVGASSGSPSAFLGSRRPVTTPLEPFEPGRQRGKIAAIAAVTPDFFRTMDLRTTRGRAFTELDGEGTPAVAVVTEQLARDLYQTTDVIGRTVLLAPDRRPAPVGTLPPAFPAPAPGAPTPVTIVGVAADITSLPTASRPDNILFVPLAQRFDTRTTVLVVARGTSGTAPVGRLREEIRKVAPQLVVSAAGTGAVLLEGPFFLVRVIGRLAAALGGLAFVLAMAGLFGILTHVVERRTREIGIRLAIGAARGQILRLILRDGLHPVLKGVVLGLTIGMGSRIALRGQILTTIGAWDPLEFCLLPLLFLAAALIACAIPAVRAARVDPNVALRDL